MKHRRRSLRLPHHDYAAPGAYFVTLVTHERTPIFGRIEAGRVRLCEPGRIAREEWFRTAELRSNVVLFAEEFVVMPNHVHGVVRSERALAAVRRYIAENPLRWHLDVYNPERRLG